MKIFSYNLKGEKEMKTLVIQECGNFEIPCEFKLDLEHTIVKNCTGCWSCWLKTPGRCMNKDLDEFYRFYLDADKVIVFSKVTQGFVSGNLKTLFDRMIPLFLPFITYKTGESMHVPRYEKYPEVKCEIVKPIGQFSLVEV